MLRDKSPQPAFDGVDYHVRSGRACGDADGFHSVKPCTLQIVGRLHMVNMRAKTGAGFDEFLRIVAVCAANDDDHAAFLGEFDGRILPLFRWLADGVNETHFRPRKALPHQSYEFADLFNGLGGL